MRHKYIFLICFVIAFLDLLICADGGSKGSSLIELSEFWKSPFNDDKLWACNERLQQVLHNQSFQGLQSEVFLQARNKLFRKALDMILQGVPSDSSEVWNKTLREVSGEEVLQDLPEKVLRAPMNMALGMGDDNSGKIKVEKEYLENVRIFLIEMALVLNAQNSHFKKKSLEEALGKKSLEDAPEYVCEKTLREGIVKFQDSREVFGEEEALREILEKALREEGSPEKTLGEILENALREEAFKNALESALKNVLENALKSSLGEASESKESFDKDLEYKRIRSLNMALEMFHGSLQECICQILKGDNNKASREIEVEYADLERVSSLLEIMKAILSRQETHILNFSQKV